MDRTKAIATAKVLRKGKITCEPGKEPLKHESISLAKKHVRSIGRGVALKAGENFPAKQEN